MTSIHATPKVSRLIFWVPLFIWCQGLANIDKSARTRRVPFDNDNLHPPRPINLDLSFIYILEALSHAIHIYSAYSTIDKACPFRPKHASRAITCSPL